MSAFRIQSLLPLLLLAVSCKAPRPAQQLDFLPRNAAFTRQERVSASNLAVEGNQQLPQILEANYIDLSQIGSISKFRSSEGHDYSDAFESCRNMKHYFKPKADADSASIRIFSPITGIVIRTQEEWAGTKIDIRPDRHPAFLITIFHVRLVSPLRPGDKVAAGQQLGFHIGKQTWSDIAVSISANNRRKFVSYFEVMPDSIFEEYRNRGVLSRDSAIISKQTRDSDPLTCQEGKFTSHGRLPSWILLTQGHELAPR